MAGVGTTLSDLYSLAQRLKLELREGLERLEKLEGAVVGGGILSHDEPLALSADLTQSMRLKLAELQKLTTEMDRMCRSQVNRSQLWRRKVEVIAEEGEALRLGLDKYLGRENRRQREAQERAELFDRTTAREGKQVLNEFEADQRDLDTAKNASKMLEETLLTGYATLKRMAEQREILKGAQRRALDVLNYVGLSDTVLKRINRRQYMDKLIAYGGMIFVLGVVFVVWRLTR